jgi:hypothetical protein
VLDKGGVRFGKFSPCPRVICFVVLPRHNVLKLFAHLRLNSLTKKFQESIGLSAFNRLVCSCETVSQCLLSLGSERHKGFAWTRQVFQEMESGSMAGVVFGAAIVMVFLILAAMYGEMDLADWVLFALPFALWGALIAIWLRGLENDVYYRSVW